MQDPRDPNAGGDSTDRSGEDSPLRLPAGELPESQRLTAQPPSGPFDSESAGEAPLVDGAAVPEPGEKPAEAALPTWERMEEEGFWVSLFQTLKEVLIQPSRTFSRMPETDNIGRPLLFAIILLLLGAIVSGAYNLLSLSLNPEIMEEQKEIMTRLERLGFTVPEVTPQLLLMSTCLTAALLPVVFVVWMFVASAVSHLTLVLLGAKSRGYETTFRTMAYVVGATAILWLIPRWGTFPIAFIWAIVSGIAGLSQTQKTSPAVAAIAVVAPLLFCCMCIGGLSLLPGLLAGAMQRTMGLP